MAKAGELIIHTQPRQSFRVGVGDNANNVDDVDKGSGGSEGEGEGCES